MSRSLNYRQIEAFRAVMLTGTTIAAAERLNTTQPSISRLLTQIQSTTKLKLFELDRGRLRPTPEATKLFEAVQRSFVGLEKIEEAVSLIKRSGVGVFRIACTPTLGISILPHAITQFQKKYPDVYISLRTLGSPFIREGLLNGAYDVGLTTSRIDEKVLRTEVLSEVEAVCVMGKDHALASEGTITPKHFSENNLITLDGDDDLNDEWRRILADKKVKPRSVIETTYSATICTLAAAGAGMGVVNPYIASVFADRLRIAPLKPAVQVKAFVAYPRHVAASTLTSAFVDVLDAALNQKRRAPGQKRT